MKANAEKKKKNITLLIGFSCVVVKIDKCLFSKLWKTIEIVL